ncbi:MAG: MarR family transcriptional regulator [Candidatus Doudnabacteria bacterium]|nr:MarR family transcriptional regulator [Candidatus Doudnabacteria bacterium]
MNKVNASLGFFLDLAKIQAVMARKFDGKLNGLSLSDFMILYRLSLAEGGKLRRIDLAEQIGLTASGVTRLLLPMEKVGLVKRQSNEHDARVSFVMLAPGGKRKLEEAMERAGLFADEILQPEKNKRLAELSGLLSDLAKSF